MSTEAELVGRIAESMAPASQEQPETIEAETTETEEVTEEVAEVEADTESEGDTEETLEGVEENDQELTGSDDEGEFFYQIGDKEYSATEVESWKDNGLRQSDYTQKTQKLSEDRKAFESDMKAQKAELQSTIDAVKDLVKVEGDWESGEDGLPLYDEDMAKYQRAKAKQDQINQLLSDAGNKSVIADTPEHIASENEKILAAIPTWQDEDVRAKDLDVMTKYLNDIGYSTQGQPYSSALYIMAKDAALGRKVSESGASIEKKLRKAPKIVKPKQAKQTAKRTQLQEAQAKFRKSGGKSDRAGVERFKQFV